MVTLSTIRTYPPNRGLRNASSSQTMDGRRCLERGVGRPGASRPNSVDLKTRCCTSAASRFTTSDSRRGVAADDVLQVFLPPGVRHRQDVGRYGGIGDRGQRGAALEDGAGRFGAPTGVALIDERGQLTAVQHGRSVEQAARKNVDGADVPVKQVHRVDALAAHLGVEIIAAAGKPAALQDVV